MKIIKMTAQQGDVLLKKLSSFPAGERKKLKKNSRGEMVLAEGETTGHYHGIKQDESDLYEVGGTVVMDLKKPAVLNHQEHGNIKLDKGVWQVGIVNEYDYVSEMKRKVVD